MATRIRMVAATLALIASVNACRSQTKPPEAQTSTLDVTDWTEKTELFMEYPPLVAGKNALFAVHLTQMTDFKPVAAGQAKVEFTPETGQATTLVGPKPSRPGAF